MQYCHATQVKPQILLKQKTDVEETVEDEVGRILSWPIAIYVF